MEITKEFVTIDERDAGLDRATINHGGQIQLPQKPPQAADNHGEDDGDEKHRSLRVAISEKRHGAAVKIRRTLHISKGTDIEGDLGQQDSVLANPVTMESDSRLKEKIPIPDKTTMKDFMHDPIDTVKLKVSGQGNHQMAANIASKEIAHGQDVDLLNAHDDMQHAQTEERKAEATGTFDELIKERQNMYVRWTLDRHITKVRLLPRDRFVRKRKADFQIKDAHGNVAVDWRAYGQHLAEYAAQQYGGHYIGYGMDHPAPSKESIMPNIERLIVASTPFQEFIMTTRRVYRWENPTETTKYLLIYIVLWVTNLLLPGMLSAIVYLVLERKFSEKTVKNLRQDVERTEDRQKTALSLTEYIQKEGDEQWADKILEEVGPWLMVQLSDLANSFEVLRNFYEWRVPSRTIIILATFVVIILASAIVPAWLFIKSLTLGMGFTFFGLFPFAVNFPEYRLLASLPKRIFWKIPTHGEWSIKSIQAEGSRYQENHGTAPSTIPNSALTAPQTTCKTQDYGVYTAHDGKTKGRLVISNTSVRFTSHHHSNPASEKANWVLLYSELERVEKIDRVVGKNMPKPKSDSGKDLKLQCKRGEERIVTNVDLRDQVFSQIIGFSDAVWQIVW
ncbi:hypothetical protein K458DRAFT_460041 [Lentithecium fluviatile CBS 122367]|uniref:Uncharacterized protein n=1 Tax=Lentithecium fluviatile CBS 122367 TaxID=1168545 RepID=A0A6G1IP26_9PLEO|nr:hypothetical protein K458DRAFT_460041 [Lentithecium fluviatile CBS 122367]